SGASAASAERQGRSRDAEEPEAGSRGEICPWEASESPVEKEGKKGKEKEKIPAEKRITRQAALASPARSLEQGGSDRAAACPWESQDTGQPPATPRPGSPGLPKPSKPPSGTSPSAEKADICPWETQESEGSSKADICPWESPDAAQLAVKPRAGSPGLPKPSKPPSGTSPSTEKA
ncbi:GP179 protein, partial [Nothocercus nigrocapillus]|nr:GP179 protein [Nothocercus nigrocapillus]